MADSRKSSWRDELREIVTRSVATADDYADVGMRRLRKRLGRSGRPKIQPYTGYATADTVHLHGRILTNPPLDEDFSNDRWWHNLANTVQRFASDELPGVRVRASLGDAVGHAVSDNEGYFNVKMDRRDVGSELPFWTDAAIAIVDHPQTTKLESATACKVMAVPVTANFVLISDVDDTIMHTGATSLGTMAKLTFFSNARTRAPLPGIAGWYEAMHRSRLMRSSNQIDAKSGVENEPINPIFYVSSSPWNLYDLLEDFIEINAIPDGPILLRDLGFDHNKFLKGGHDHKLDKARRLSQAYPDLPFVLSGDSGQEDARLYAAAAAEFGSRIKAIFVRDIDPMGDSEHDAKVDQYRRECQSIGVPMFAVKDSIEAARYCVDLGLLDPSKLASVEAATLRDEQRSASPLKP
ncbi:Phosphatidate phosphatase APP1 [Neorhodopirellula lusitana]|uniref:Phosphatidate phosphatase APP1 n=1 Tax=Neorhodopirellula lusitana TaxID=445327 RepID=A0ABY1QEK8_9BACT|nr:phosphatase domain-containing protein [Neorhodopirellula lusitana]SMP67014.1 Phosphatidate phosphatase APP1 [Neorhodopirellula lusitana]